ncbi:hypothetical protein [Luteolibacter marinus]|uniref:hypothetical protein n=1 Tax=Luteolibacter marinus TaxID=2776705 RepID=UPI001868543E|nr:hypothetical protein [Luteolibacter marinus]
MKKALFPLWLVAATPLAAIPASTTLTLVSEPDVNRITVTVDPGAFPDTDTTTLTGSVDAAFDIDPQAGTTDELTLSNGRVNGTAMNFSGGFGSFGYNINMTGLSAAISTIAPPGSVNPANGQFPAEEHQFVIDQGSVTGTALGNPVSTGFTPESPAGGAGTGTGTVTLTPAGDLDGYRNFNVVVTFPVAIDDTFDADGTPVAVVATGTIKAAGTVQVPLSAYVAWTVDEGIPGAEFDAVPAGGSVPYGVVWALGLGAADNPLPHLPMPDPSASGGFAITLPPGGSAGPIVVESSDDLDEWLPVAAEDLSPALNPLPAGTSGTVQVTADGNDRRFVRLKVIEP